MELLFISLGCDKNRSDTEHMLSALAKAGYTFTDDEEAAEVIVVNTCCFISDAMAESIQTIIDMGQYKQAGRLKYLVVTGCLGERHTSDILEQLPEVDAIIGTNSFDELVAVLNDLRAGQEQVVCKKPLTGLPSTADGRLLSTGGHYAHLKIAEGCAKHCTYCVIPSIRGDYRSVPMEELIAEAAELAEAGVQELILVAQETTLYGSDLYGENRLPQLLEELSRIEGIQWLRLQYCYPEEITPQLIEAMARLPKVCHYIDMPIQHANDLILGRMGRRTSAKDIRAKVAALRAAMPDIAIRTTLICGFPGETEAQHQELLEFVDELAFDRLGCFAYSQQEGTPAASFDDQVDEELKEARVAEVMELQQEISFAANEALVGQQLTVFIEGRIPEEGILVGRTYRDAPDIDGFIFIQSEADIPSGTFVQARVTEASEYDLIGELA